MTAELELLNRLTREFAPHGFDLPLDRVFSPATVAKHYLSAMGVKPPQDKFVIPDTINGIAMQSFFAGRAECNITRTPVGVTYVDLHAQFSAVSSSLACREILCAQSLEFPDFTAGARRMVEQTTLDDCARPEFWKRLRWYARVEANDAVLPMRAKFSKSENADPTLGWNFLTSKQPIWITGPDAIAAKLLGKPPKILEAIAVVPHGVQPGLTSIKLYGEIDVDPRRDDLAVKLVELRALLKKKNPRLAGGSKVSANSAAFGIFGQLDVKDLDLSTALNVSSGDAHYHILPDTIWEKPSEFYCPVIASLVTGGSHLLCAMLERAVRDRGGYIAAMDTDSAMIVSTKDGGLIPCAGGPDRLDEYHLASGHTAVRALSWAEVDQIREQFESLNPWRETLNTPFLKLEKENLAANGERRQLYAYCIAAKLYCLFNLDENGLVIRKPSGHGLGFLQAPYSIRDWEAKTRRKWDEGLPPYIFEAWHYIVSRALGLRYKSPAWLQQPAVMTVPITRPRVLEQLGRFKDKLRPFTVVMIPFPKKTLDLLWKGYFIMPYRDKLDDLGGRSMVNVVSGETFYIHDPASPAKPSPWWLSLETMRDEIDHILSRTESKFCTPNGSTCTSQTIGLLLRRHIVAGEFHYIGKEASTSWGSGPSLTMLAGADAVDAADKTYREYERVVDPKYLDEIRTAAKQFSTKRLSRQAKLAEGTIRKFKNGKNCIRPRTLRKLTRAIHDLANKYAQSIAGG